MMGVHADCVKFTLRTICIIILWDKLGEGKICHDDGRWGMVVMRMEMGMGEGASEVSFCISTILGEKIYNTWTRKI